MTDYEEPAAKISKLVIPAKDQDEEMDEGQEEWLSEGILTDDDYNPATDQDKSDHNMSVTQDDQDIPSLPDEDTHASSPVQDNSHIEDSTHVEDSSVTHDRNDSVTPDNIDYLDTSQDNSTTQVQDNSNTDNSTTQGDSQSQGVSDVQGNTNSLDSHVQDNSSVLDNFQEKESVQDESLIDKLQDKDNLHMQEDTSDISKQALDEKIEQTLDNFENSQQSEIPDELGAFLVKKPDHKTADDKKDASDVEESPKHSDDDGNDTDELLRMLGEDGQKNKNKKEVKKVEQKRIQESQSSDDDEYIFGSTKVSRLKVAKNVTIVKKFPTKAVPEVSDRDDDSDASSDEVETVQKIFVTRKGNYASKSTAKPTSRQALPKKIVINRAAPEKRQVTSSPLPKTKPQPKPRPEPEITISRTRGLPDQRTLSRTVPQVQKVRVIRKDAVKAKETPRPKVEPEEIIDEEEFLEREDHYDLDEEFQSEPSTFRQRIMRPEQMDEEVPTDGESHSEDDDSMYDEFPSSESDQDDWFTLDVRGERAGDYIPLLGSKAHQLLSAEKQRVTSRLHSLRQNLSAMQDSSQRQAELLRRATHQLAELDAALKA